jgi:flagellar motor protein MotB
MAQQKMITEMEARFNKNFALMLTELQKKNQMMSEFDPRDASPGSRFSSRPSSAQGILTERQILDKSQPKGKPDKVQAPERGPSSSNQASPTKSKVAAQQQVQQTSKQSKDKTKKEESEEEEYYDEEEYDAEDAA